MAEGTDFINGNYQRTIHYYISRFSQAKKELTPKLMQFTFQLQNTQLTTR